MTEVEDRVRVVLRIHPFVLCSAVQMFLAENRRLDVVVADEPSAADDVVAPDPEHAVHVVLREDSLDFEVSRDDRREYYPDLAALAGQLNRMAGHPIVSGGEL